LSILLTSSRPAVISGTTSQNLSVPATYGGKRMELTPEQWSNLFGERMLAAARADLRPEGLAMISIILTIQARTGKLRAWNST